MEENELPVVFIMHQLILVKNLADNFRVIFMFDTKLVYFPRYLQAWSGFSKSVTSFDTHVILGAGHLAMLESSVAFF